MMSNRRIYSSHRERDIAKPGRFISIGQNNHDLLRSYSRNTGVIAVNSSSSSRSNSARSIVFNNSYDYRTQNNYTKRGFSFDWLTDSETGTPDFQSPDSDSSTGSLLSRADAAAAKRLAEEWEKLERTLYNEEGPKVTQKHLIEECKQWRELFPHLRVVGRELLNNKNAQKLRKIEAESTLQNLWEDNDKLIDEEQFLFSYHSPDSSLSNESSDDENYSLPHGETNNYNHNIDTLCVRDKLAKKYTENDNITKLIGQKQLEVSLSSLLHITPIKLTNSSIGNMYRGSYYSSILRSEISSSRWRRNIESPNSLYPDIETNSSLPILTHNSHNSAKPIILMNGNKKKVISSLSAGVNRTGQWKIPPSTAISKNRDINRLAPLNHPFPLVEKSIHSSAKQHPRQQGDIISNRKLGKSQRKVSLPPIQSSDAVFKNSTNSGISTIISSKKKSLIPINIAANKNDMDSDKPNSSNSILKVFENDSRRPRSKYSYIENKSFERY